MMLQFSKTHLTRNGSTEDFLQELTPRSLDGIAETVPHPVLVWPPRSGSSSSICVWIVDVSEESMLEDHENMVCCTVSASDAAL